MQQMLEMLLVNQAAQARMGAKLDAYYKKMRAWRQKIDSETVTIQAETKVTRERKLAKLSTIKKGRWPTKKKQRLSPIQE
jgi:hypothetical protein